MMAFSQKKLGAIDRGGAFGSSLSRHSVLATIVQ